MQRCELGLDPQMIGLNPKIIGIFGLQGCGKTMAMTALGYLAHKKKVPIYSNYHLEYPYTPIDTLEDINQIHDGVFLADELWLWCFSRSSQTKLNQDLIKIVMLNRKRNVTIVYTTQNIIQVDKLLRLVTTTWVEPHIRPIRVPVEHKVEDMIDDEYRKRHRQDNQITHEEIEDEIWRSIKKTVNVPENYRVKARFYNAHGYLTGCYYFKNLKFWGSMYNTREEIGQLHRSRQIPFTIKQGIELENQFVEAVEDLTWVQETDHLPDSGWKSGKKFDVILQTDYGTLAIDVKSTNQTRVSVYPEYLQAQITNAATHEMIPFIVFPRMDRINQKERMKEPDSWMAHPIKGSYLLDHRTPPKYGKLERNSIEFPLLPTLLKNQIQDREVGTLFTT